MCLPLDYGKEMNFRYSFIKQFLICYRTQYWFLEIPRIFIFGKFSIRIHQCIVLMKICHGLTDRKLCNNKYTCNCFHKSCKVSSYSRLQRRTKTSLTLHRLSSSRIRIFAILRVSMGIGIFVATT
jgi:hypothetical protein